MCTIQKKLKTVFGDKYGRILLLCMCAALAFLIWKAPYGYVYNDEAFYLAVPYRLCQGDALIRDEWHPAQLFAFLTFPAMKLYLSIFNSSESIALGFRYLYIAAQTLASLWIFSRLRRFSPVAGIIGTLCFMLYNPFNIMSLSYNTLGIMLLITSGSTMAASGGGKRDAVISGLCFAGAVLCCPYLIAIFPLYCLVCLIPFLRKKLPFPAFEVSYWLFFLLGASALAVLLLAFMLSRASLSELIAAFPELFNDAEHQSVSFMQIIHDYFESIYGNFWFNSYTLSIPLLALVILADRKRLQHRCLYIPAAALISAGYMLYYLKHLPFINLVVFPLNILGMFAFFLCRKRDARPFVFLFLLGFAYSICIHIASNLTIFNITSSFIVALPASIYYIFTLGCELYREASYRRILGAALMLSLVLQLGFICLFRTHTMYDAPAYYPSMSNRIETGVLKGIITSPVNADNHALCYADTQAVRDTEAHTAVYYCNEIWLYLEDPARCGAFSDWPSFLKSLTAIERMEKYWRMNPDKLPDSFYLSYHLPDAEECLSRIGAYSYEISELNNGWLLKK